MRRTTTRLILLIWPILIFFNSQFIAAEERELNTFDYNPRTGIAIGEALGYNIFQSGFNRFVLDTTYSYISIDSVVENLTSPWVWDSDTFFVNHVGHPYQGSVYFTAARSSHLNFYESSAITILGSITWEYFMENERQSINDLIVTTTGGAALGEMLYRLSDLVWSENDSWANSFLSFLISPFSGINKSLFNELTPSEKPQPVHGQIRSTASLMFAFAEYESTSVESPTDIPGIDDLNLSLNSSMDLTYGNPFSDNFTKPFEFFTFYLTGGLLNDGLLLEFFSEGLLTGSSVYLDDDGNRERMVGLFLGLDFLYGTETINLGSNSIGFGYLQKITLKNDVVFDIDLYLNVIFIGSSDYPMLKYNDSLSSPVYERRNYSLGIGENLKLFMNLEKRGFGSISLEYLLYGIHILSETVEEDASDGYDLTGLFRLSVEKNISERWRLGSSFFMYHKNGFYDSSGNNTSIFPGFSLYSARIF